MMQEKSTFISTNEEGTTLPVAINNNYENYLSAKTYIASHSHNEAELFYMRQGKVIISLNNVSHYLESDQLILILPGSSHSIRSITAQPFFYVTIKFALDFLKSEKYNIFNAFYYKIENHSMPLEYVIAKNTEKGSAITDLLEKTITLYKAKPPGYEVGVKGLLELILFNIISQTSSTHKHYDNTNELQVVYEYIENNYMNNISIDTLANLANMSKFYFIRYFHKDSGMTPIEYINMLRIKKACEMLEDEQDQRILDISLSVGFNDLSYFNRLFKRVMGVTPSEYKKRLQSKNSTQKVVFREEAFSMVPFYSFML